MTSSIASQHRSVSEGSAAVRNVARNGLIGAAAITVFTVTMMAGVLLKQAVTGVCNSPAEQSLRIE